MTWEDFASWLSTLYALADRQLPTVFEWINDVYRPAGITPEEARAAVLDLARSGTARARFFTDVLGGVTEAAREARIAALLAREHQQRASDETPGPESCRDCRDTGWCPVPVPDDRKKPGEQTEWVMTCRCAAGVRLAAVCRDHKGRAPASLAQYEAYFAGLDWRALLRRRKAEEVARGRIAGSTREWDQLTARLLARARGAR